MQPGQQPAPERFAVHPCGRVRIPGLGTWSRGRVTFDARGLRPRVIVRDDTAVHVYELPDRQADAGRVPEPDRTPTLTPAASFRAPAESPLPVVGSLPVAADLSYAVLVGESEYHAIAETGEVLWEREFTTEPASPLRIVRVGAAAPGVRPGVWLSEPEDAATLRLVHCDADGRETVRMPLPLAGPRFGRTPVLWGLDGKPRFPSPGPGVEVPFVVDPLDGAEISLSGDGALRRRTADGRSIIAQLTPGSFPRPLPGHIRPYLEPVHHRVDAATALVVLADDYDEAAVEQYGPEQWREFSAWAVVPHTGEVLGPIPTEHEWAGGLWSPADGTWVTWHGEILTRWQRTGLSPG
ncbi:hypothetical protein [Yinghuangia soli]|uniref:Uncharacterized protein n=1 Tax=Yinghuangia soli TaxID=2908204 RepID=A0AA41U1M5_9ACTN|nr:hypothetical protein [Yinghuangia soli]MCF2527717.1 hypothetical protein [Yinghuangia soli]